LLPWVSENVSLLGSSVSSGTTLLSMVGHYLKNSIHKSLKSPRKRVKKLYFAALGGQKWRLQRLL